MELLPIYITLIFVGACNVIFNHRTTELKRRLDRLEHLASLAPKPEGGDNS
jgi:hypothetical protein